MTDGPRSYTSPTQGLRATVGEAVQLFRGGQAARAHLPGDIAKQIALATLARSAYQKATGTPLSGKKAVEIGAGQTLLLARALGTDNDVVATDLDVFVEGFDLGAYRTMLRQNGAKRTLKTIGRKVLGVDSNSLKELRRQLGVARLPKAVGRQMDATKLDFPDGSIDLVYSFNVFEHLPDPTSVWRDAKRVLRTGGVLLTHLHLYTSDSGCHDLRIIRGEHDQIGHWPHLRPSEQRKVQNSAYLNKFSLAEWRRLLDAEFPGGTIEHIRDDEHRGELERLRAEGELGAFSDEDLLTRNVVSVWRKP